MAGDCYVVLIVGDAVAAKERFSRVDEAAGKLWLLLEALMFPIRDGQWPSGGNGFRFSCCFTFGLEGLATGKFLWRQMNTRQLGGGGSWKRPAAEGRKLPAKGAQRLRDWRVS